MRDNDLSRGDVGAVSNGRGEVDFCAKEGRGNGFLCRQGRKEKERDGLTRTQGEREGERKGKKRKC
jgi:hypothetical protein